jgi:hypothetical protein
MTIQKFTRTVRRDYCKAYTDFCGISIKVRQPARLAVFRARVYLSRANFDVCVSKLRLIRAYVGLIGNSNCTAHRAARSALLIVSRCIHALNR